MATRIRPFAVLFVACLLFGACGSDDPPAATATTIGTNIDCTVLKDTMTSLTVNWQVIVGLVDTPTTEWADLPAGDIENFGAQLAVAGAALGKNLQAAGALKYMADANDIVKRGLDGDAAAQADLATYLGPDAGVSINKQIPIALAYTQAGCS